MKDTLFRRFVVAIPAFLAAIGGHHAAVGLEIVFDYRFDSLGFFDDPERREAMDLAADVVNRYVDDLDAIVPADGNGWSSFISRPDGSGTQFFGDEPIAQDTMVIYVAGRSLSDRLAQSIEMGAVGTSDVNPPDEDWALLVKHRGELGALDEPATDFGTVGGTISFDVNEEAGPWHFDSSTADLKANEFDLITVAMHEILHIMGIGISNSWEDHISGQNRFIGSESLAVGSPTNPDLDLDEEGFHFLFGTKSTWNGEEQEALLAPGIFPGRRAFPTVLDRAALRDIGWEEAMPGDANRDRRFGTSDLLAVFQSGKYETGLLAGWSEGDWNDDGIFDSSDLIAGLQTGQYELPAAALSVHQVPEPTGLALLAFATLGLWRRRRVR